MKKITCLFCIFYKVMGTLDELSTVSLIRVVLVHVRKRPTVRKNNLKVFLSEKFNVPYTFLRHIPLIFQTF
jgi:hypothetical protein